MSLDRRDFLLSPISAAGAPQTGVGAGVTIQDLQDQIAALQKSLNTLTATVAAQHIYKSIKEFGAKGDGVTDDTPACIAAIAWAKTQARWTVNADFYMPRLLGVKIYFPHGDYLIKTPKALLDFDFDVVGNAPYGLAFEGEAFGGTRILYQPTVSGPLCYNNACLARIEFNNLMFHCNDANSDFFDSVGPRAQNYSFNHCHWTGTWKYGIALTGTDNNSPMQFNGCIWLGSFTYFLYGNSVTADQFVDFWFVDCCFQMTGSTLIYSEAKGGGHYHFVNCEVDGFEPASPTYLIKLMGKDHFAGVPVLSWVNGRFELRNTKALVLYCEWGFGNILFESCDFAAAGSSPGTFSPFYFNRANEIGPTIRFESCQLMGNHEYHYTDGAETSVQSVVYDGCQLMESTGTAANDMIIQTYDGASISRGAMPVAHFRNCENFFTQSGRYIIDTDVGWSAAHIGQTSAKLVSLKDTAGNFPHGGSYGAVVLPKNAVVTKVTWYSKSANNGNTMPFAYRIRSSEATPKILSTVTGSNVSVGFSMTTNIFFQCGVADTTRTIILDEIAGQSSSLTNSYVILEYIG